MKLIIILFIILNFIETFSQSSVFNKKINTNDYFEFYEPPNITMSVKNMLKSLNVDSNAIDVAPKYLLFLVHLSSWCCPYAAKRIEVSPIYFIGNDLPTNSFVWTDIKDSIKSVSKHWIIKPKYWVINKDDDSVIINFKNESNNNKRELPDNGRKEYFFIIQITSETNYNFLDYDFFILPQNLD